MDRIEIFKKELSLIKDNSIRKFVEDFLNQVPEYFFNVAASSTGKYHPDYALGEGGLIRHTKAATRIAYEMCRLDMFKYDDIEKDLILASLILHDTYKHGKEYQTYTITKHPLVASTEIINFESDIKKEYKDIISSNISTHMGQWNMDYKTKEVVLPLPKTKMQNFVHICDYLASRKCLEFNFEADLS